ncbi:MAG: hypothetical protein D6715_10650 [Calditrichaeota bacterium]|nr:MAG: hypothetical protein D6715_10650 [Calditrichota bacterium]
MPNDPAAEIQMPHSPLVKQINFFLNSQGLQYAVSSQVAQELQRLTGWLREHGHRLRQQGREALEEKPPLPMESFAKGKSSCLYTFSGQQRWFLKYFYHQAQRKLRSEAFGLATMFQLFKVDPYVALPEGLCVDFNHQFLLTTQVNGIRLSKLFYLNSWQGWLSGVRDGTAHIFYQLGRILGRVHREGERQLPGGPPVQAFLAERFANALNRIPAQVPESAWLKRWFHQLGFEPRYNAYVHRNLNLNNILVDGDRLVLLDFETFGRGDAFEDLGQLMGNLIVLRAVVGFPKGLIAPALRAFWAGYGQEEFAHKARLESAVKLHLANYYVRIFLLRRWPRTISGLPVSRRRLRRLIESSLLLI